MYACRVDLCTERVDSAFATTERIEKECSSRLSELQDCRLRVAELENQSKTQVPENATSQSIIDTQRPEIDNLKGAHKLLEAEVNVLKATLAMHTAQQEKREIQYADLKHRVNVKLKLICDALRKISSAELPSEVRLIPHNSRFCWCSPDINDALGR